MQLTAVKNLVLLGGTAAGKSAEEITLAVKLTSLMVKVTQFRVRKDNRERIVDMYSRALFHKSVRALTSDDARILLAMAAVEGV